MKIAEKQNINVSGLSPLPLAFIGDTVFDLLVREYLVGKANRPVSQLHALASKMVCAPAQAKAYDLVRDILTEEEQAVFRRGRNAHTGGVPKNASSAQYHVATGLEALFGWLYLNGKKDRINELFDVIMREEYDV